MTQQVPTASAGTPAPPPQLRYAAKLFGPGFPSDGKVVEEFLAAHDNDAVDHVRSEHLEKQLPLEGGAFRVEVEALDMSRNFAMAGKKKITIEGPPGVVTEFEVHHEPHPSVASEIRAKAAELEALHAEHEKHDAALDKLVAAGTVTEAQVSTTRLLPPEARDARRAKRESRIAHHRERVANSLDQLVADGALSADAAQQLKESVK